MKQLGFFAKWTGLEIICLAAELTLVISFIL